MEKFGDAIELVREKTAMAELTLKSLEVQNFRGFEHLQIERLGRVNLIVGKNNVGKTSLLEALRLYANKMSPDVLWEILYKRDERVADVAERTSEAMRREVDIEQMLASLRYIFYGRSAIHTDSMPVIIGPVNTPEEKMSFEIKWRNIQLGDDVVRQMSKVQIALFENLDNPTEERIPHYVVQWGQRIVTDAPLFFTWRSLTRLLRATDSKDNHCIYIGSDGLLLRLIDVFWSAISLTALEQEVLTALRIIAPGIEALNIVRQDPRSIIVKVDGVDDPLPLRSLGNGMLRALGIVLALVNARDGMLLIDELENGLHYSVQADIWRLIFRLAYRLNIQVFVTTHSWDCIEGFLKAGQEIPDEEGVLISLENRKTGIGAVIFDMEELKIVTREHIEVR